MLASNSTARVRESSDEHRDHHPGRDDRASAATFATVYCINSSAREFLTDVARLLFPLPHSFPAVMGSRSFVKFVERNCDNGSDAPNHISCSYNWPSVPNRREVGAARFRIQPNRHEIQHHKHAQAVCQTPAHQLGVAHRNEEAGTGESLSSPDHGLQIIIGLGHRVSIKPNPARITGDSLIALDHPGCPVPSASRSPPPRS